MNFRPLPFLSNPHVQTILGNLLSGVPRRLRSERRIVALPDGDRLALHETPSREVAAPIVLLVHGLGGCHRSPYMQRTAARLSALGWRVLRMDLRGAGAGMRLARRFYNAGCSQDLREVITSVVARFPGTPLAVVGFSLGGNIVLKCAGEMGEQTPSELRGVAAVAPPIDLVRCSELIARYPLYDAFYVRHLTQQVAKHQRCFPDLPCVQFPRRLLLRTFDDLYTSPRWGFKDSLDYYSQASSLPWIGSIRVPTFILTSRDDPFVAVEPFEQLAPAKTLEVNIANHGGHMGFLGFDGTTGIRWSESRVIDWLVGLVRAQGT